MRKSINKQVEAQGGTLCALADGKRLNGMP